MRLLSPQVPAWTALSTPTAAVVSRSKPCPTWSAWHLVRSSKSVSRGSEARGRYCSLRSSLRRAAPDCRLLGERRASSAVGISCSPGRTHRIGPSLLS
uniref:Uncharacterized protein n=1 Tax=Ixodes ricinus TaxID=34613 RepID=A0A6B0UAT8_IXORI